MIFILLFFFVLICGFVYWIQKIQRKIKKFSIEQKEERDLVFNALMEGILFIDKQGKIEYVNFTASRILGSSKKLLEGRVIPEKKGSILLNKTKELLISCERLQAPLTDSVVMGEENKVHLDLIVMPRESKLGFIIVFQDKSSHHKILEVGKDFVSSASHELKTPITIIRGFAETLQDMKDLPKEIVEDILEKIVRNCHRMDTLVKNLLTLADIESLPLSNAQYCDLTSLVEECKRVVLSVYPNASICIESESEVITAEVDPSLLELAILNLLGNGVKYSASPAEIVVSMHQNPDELQIKITDRGIGIPSVDLEHVFDRFYTVNKAHSRKLGGAGLGLSLVKTIIEKHGGTIQVASVLGEGSIFTVCLPCHQH